MADVKKGNKSTNKNAKLCIKSQKKEIFLFKGRKSFFKYYLILAIFISLWQIFSFNSNKSTDSKSNFITLKIAKEGKAKIFCSNSTLFSSTYYPNRIYINGNQTNIYYTFDFSQDNNEVKLEWDYKINNCIHMFRDCKDITEIDLSNFDTSLVTDMSFMFYGCTSLISINLTNINTSNVIKMFSMFYNCNSLKSLDLSYFDTSNVSDMHYMFSFCTSLEILNISNFNTSNVEIMHDMFNNCSSLVSLDLSNFDTSKVAKMNCMFLNCSSLKSLDLTKFNTSLTTQMGSMFYGCSLLKSLDLSNFNTSQVLNMDYMFSGCKKLVSLNISNFDVSGVVNMKYMFHTCESLESLNISNFKNSQVNDTSFMFYGCKSLKILDISNFDTSHVEDMRNMFRLCSSLTSLNLSNFDTSNAKYMLCMFLDCTSMTNLDISNFNTSHATQMGSMFKRCSSLVSLNLSNFNASQVVMMDMMFYECSSLKSLDLSNFKTPNVKNMDRMFYGCSNLTSLNLSNFDTSKVTNMNQIFYNCSSLASLDLSKFITPLINSTKSMFYGCSNLTSLDLSNFNTSNVIDMSNMFYNCSSLTSLDLSNFNTSNVLYISNMFFNCSSLTSLDLSNFNTSNVLYMHKMFYGCENLEYINMNNFDDNKVKILFDFFYGIPENLVVCIDENKNTEVYNQIKNRACFTIDCSSNWKSKQKKIINETGECIENCSSSPYKYEYNGKCLQSCPNGTYNEYKCKCELQNCLECSPVSLMYNLCTKCIDNYYPKENDPENLGQYFKCYNNPPGYYLDNETNLYKKCYFSCESCGENGNDENHNCLVCKKEYHYIIKKISGYNCYKTCPHYYYFNMSDNQSYCTIDSSCPNDYPKLLKDEKECIKAEEISTNFFNTEYSYYKTNITSNDINKDINDLIQFLDKTLTNQSQNETKPKTEEEETQYYNDLLKGLEDYLTSGEFDTTNVDKGLDVSTKIGKVSVTLTNTENQKLNSISNDKIISINLGQCEKDIRQANQIPENETLYMKNLAVEQEGMKIPKMEFDIYRKLNDSKLVKLSKSACKDSKVSLSVPVELKDDDVDKLNTSSDYFNSICYQSTSESGTDIILDDRKKDFVEGNKTICQDDCDFSDYNKDIQKANCSCDVKESSNDNINDMNINNNKLYEKLNNDKGNSKISNLGLTSCNVLSSTENIEKNTGFYLLLFILVIFAIIFIIFVTKGYNLIRQKFEDVIYNKFDKNAKVKKDIKPRRKSLIDNKIKNNNIISKSKTKQDKPVKNFKKPTKGKKGKKLKRKSSINLSKNANCKNLFVLNNQINNNYTAIIENKAEKEENKANNNIKPDTDYEFNWLLYEDALKLDKRSNCEYYGSLLRSKQLFIFTFCSFNDYNSGVIKKFMFFLSFALHYTVSALFFNEATMHQIYEDQGKYNFSYQLPFIICSAIASTVVLRLMLQFLVLTDKDVLQVKLQPTKPSAVNMKISKLKCIKIKFIIFFVSNFILLGLFWYYLTSFNAVYQNTQVYLIENTFISFAFSLFYPFIINIFPTMLRSCAIHSTNKDQRCLYKASQILQII